MTTPTEAGVVATGLYLIKAALQDQCDAGLEVVEPNKIHRGNNIWGFLCNMILPNDRELAERVRRSFVKKNPCEALALIEKIHRDYWKTAATKGLL